MRKLNLLSKLRLYFNPKNSILASTLICLTLGAPLPLHPSSKASPLTPLPLESPRAKSGGSAFPPPSQIILHQKRLRYPFPPSLNLMTLHWTLSPILKPPLCQLSYPINYALRKIDPPLMFSPLPLCLFPAWITLSWRTRWTTWNPSIPQSRRPKPSCVMIRCWKLRGPTLRLKTHLLRPSKRQSRPRLLRA